MHSLPSEDMNALTREERNLRLVLRLSAITYFVVGLAFAFAPELILKGVNFVSRALPLGLPEIPPAAEKFWLALAVSMMMTITTLCYLAQYNIRKNGGYVVPLLVAKFVSSFSALCFFIFSAKYLAYLGIFLADGAIGVITLSFYLKANKAFFVAQTALYQKMPESPKSSGPTTVVAFTGDDKIELLDRVLAATKFMEILEARYQEVYQKSGKSREAFSVVVKPNFMFMHSKSDFTSYTDPELVEHLINRIHAAGFTKIFLVESQSTYGNYYENREVLNVAKYIGYHDDSTKYKIIDLTMEMDDYDYGDRLRVHPVGRTWRDADFRISFAKNKTHLFCHYTLTLKNIYGTLPLQNKLKEYHTDREYDWPTIESLKKFEVHFGLIDAFVSADGQFGVITCNEPKHTKTIIGGENLLAVDWVGAKKMGLNPDAPGVGRYLPLAVEAFGKPEINWVGDQSVYDPWENVSEVVIQSLDFIEEAYAFSDWWFSVLTAQDAYFPLKKKAWGVLFMRKLLAPLRRILFRHDRL